MEIIKPTKVTDNQLEDINTLAELCSRHDGLYGSLDIDESFKAPDDINTFLLYDNTRLIACISLFTPSKAEAEVSAFTDPALRKQGKFMKLLREAKKEITVRGIADFLFVCDKKSADGQAVMSHMGAVYDFSEYSMQYIRGGRSEHRINPQVMIRESTPEDTEELVKLSMLSFSESEEEAENYIKHIFESPNRTQHMAVVDGKPAGMISTAVEGRKSYIHGLCVSPEYRKSGIGSALLEYKLAESLKRFPDYTVELEVMTGNSGALSIYERAGFEVKACNDYFRMPASNI